ncbi:VWA domain-containing protein [uncultured Propionibacterium sp.]|uniref:VWA domain-containing protein n=1 Tax=uncultured Propionibacterium sp. TaxID=218066 RepID=UPI00293126AD|nr:VWA domain-containing protein [uncultured Propionibacterium sp.]
MIPMLSFMSPQRLWWLIVPAVVVALYVLLMRRRSNESSNGLLQSILPRDTRLRRHVSVGAAIMSLVMLVIAYAQPQAMTKVPRDRATVVVVIDVSRSMMATDVTPTRLDAAKEGAKEFVGSLPESFNVALVSFAATADIKMPPTTDRSALENAIDALELAPSTAIGEGVYTALDALKLAPEDPDHPGETAPGAIVLLSDGATNMGRSSSEAATESKNQGVPIYTIAYGTSSGYVYENGQRQSVAVDHAELSQVAKDSGGKKYSADSLSSLQAVYETISHQIGYVDEYHEITARFAGFALIFAVLASTGVISLAARWP